MDSKDVTKDFWLYSFSVTLFVLLVMYLCHLLAHAFECVVYPQVRITFRLSYLGSSMNLSFICLVLAGCWCIVYHNRSVCVCHGSHIHSYLPDVLVCDI
jgi:hypothetical protein